MYNKILKFLIATSMVLTVEVAFAQYSNVNDIKAEEHDEKKLNQVLTEYNKSQNNPSKAEEPSSDQPKDITDEELTEEELQEFDQFANDVKKTEEKLKNIPDYKKAPIPKNLEEKKLSENIVFMLEPLRRLSDKDLEELIRARVKDSGAHKIYELEPRIYPFTVKLIKDKEALPALVRIVEDTPRLTKLLWVMVATFIFGFILKKLTSNKDQTFTTSLLFGFLRMSFMMFLRFYIVFWFFEKELTPTYKIIKEVFFS